MATAPRPSIVNVGYRSTNYWVVSAGRNRILIDLGWPGMGDALLANLARMDIPLAEIRYGVATHYHMDHAGAAQELKNRGMRLLVTEEQREAIPAMKRWMKPADRYTEIALHDNTVIALAESRALFASIGIGGELVHTPGHSDDSITVVLDEGVAFTGDLTHESMVGLEDPAVIARSWERLRERGVTTVHAGHGPIRPMHARP